MTQKHPTEKRAEDFSFAIVIRIEGRNCRVLVLRTIGIATALITVAVKVILLFMAWAP